MLQRMRKTARSWLIASECYAHEASNIYRKGNSGADWLAKAEKANMYQEDADVLKLSSDVVSRLGLVQISGTQPRLTPYSPASRYILGLKVKPDPDLYHTLL